MDPLHRRFARRVRQLMAQKGLTVNRLADFSGIARGGLSDVLRGKQSPTLRTMGKVADALNVSVRELLPEDDPPRSK